MAFFSALWLIFPPFLRILPLFPAFLGKIGQGINTKKKRGKRPKGYDKGHKEREAEGNREKVY